MFKLCFPFLMEFTAFCLSNKSLCFKFASLEAELELGILVQEVLGQWGGEKSCSLETENEGR